MRRLLMVLMAATLLFAVTTAVATQTANAAYPGGTGWIVFENDFDLYVVSADGGTPQATDTSLFNEVDPVFSPDGTKVAFARDFGGSAIWVADFDSNTGTLEATAGWVQVTSGPVDGEPTWSPDGDSIAYHRRTRTQVASGTADGVDGGDPAKLIDSTAAFNGVVQSGDTVRNVTDGSSGIVTGVAATEVTIGGGLSGGTDDAWEIGDSYTITYTSNRQLYYSDSDGSDLSGTALSADGWNDSYDDQNPAWSADGDYIAFETTRNGNADIYTLEFANPNTVVNLTPAPIDLFATRPSWSPDSSQIAFQSKQGGTDENVWRIGAAGIGLVQVTNLAGDEVEPSWSPDGSEIAFRNVADDAIYAAPANTATPGTVRLIASSVGGNANHEPDWQPVLTGVDDAYDVDEGGTLAVTLGDDVLDNDLVLVDDVGAVTATSFTATANGVLTPNANGTFTYIHDGSETTSDSFTYVPAQGSFTGDETTVTITINPVDEAPVAEDDGPVSVSNGGTVNVPAPGVLDNDTDPEGGALTAIKVADPANGTVTLNANGSFTYTHDGSNTTADSFTYQAKDAGNNTSNAATVTIKIGPLNPDPPSVAISGPSFGQLGEEVSFTSTITDGSGGPVTYKWTVTRDGAAVPPVGTSKTYSFTPAATGVYNIELEAVDSAGTGTATFRFTVMTDITGNVFASDIVWLANEGITKGCNPPTNDQYCPNATVTRGQMAAFLVRFLGLTDIDPTIEFTDTGSSIFEEDILKLATAGITKGCNPPTNDQYCPNDSVTRGQMAAFLVRALGLTDDGGGDLFDDDDDSIFEGDIDRLATAGITRGCNPPANTNFCPTDTVTRGQMAAFLHRADPLK
jgi:VCBS repeat-containing protein